MVQINRCSIGKNCHKDKNTVVYVSARLSGLFLAMGVIFLASCSSKSELSSSHTSANDVCGAISSIAASHNLNSSNPVDPAVCVYGGPNDLTVSVLKIDPNRKNNPDDKSQLDKLAKDVKRSTETYHGWQVTTGTISMAGISVTSGVVATKNWVLSVGSSSSETEVSVLHAILDNVNK